MTDPEIRKLVIEAYEHGFTHGRSQMPGGTQGAGDHADRVLRAEITRTAKPGKATYCDTGCTPERCSDTHNHREVMVELF